MDPQAKKNYNGWLVYNSNNKRRPHPGLYQAITAVSGGSSDKEGCTDTIALRKTFWILCVLLFADLYGADSYTNLKHIVFAFYSLKSFLEK